MKKIDNIEIVLNKYKNSDWYLQLELVNEKTYLQEIKDAISNYKPKIAVIGEFSTGKSTLINSFLAKDLLPAKFKPTTSFVTSIAHGVDEYILVDGEKLELTKENLESIKQVESEKINIFTDNDILKEFTIVDTPGTNDPSKFTDEIVFSLIGEVDVVIFVMNVNQALKDTEKQFISKLIKKKDIDKFFFALNWSDSIENPRVVKNEVIDKLTTLLSLDNTLLKQHTFLYSAKEVLDTRVKHEENSSYSILLENIDTYIRNNRKALLESWIEQELEKTVGSALLKIDVLKDKILGNSEKYENEIATIDNEIKTFEYEIEKELVSLEKDFSKIKENYKKHIKESVRYVLNDVSEEVNNMEFVQLIGSRYIELRTKKLFEDKTEKVSKIFITDISALINDFDKNIVDSKLISNNLNIEVAEKATTSKKIVNTTAIMLTSVAALSALPMAGGMAMGTSALVGISAGATALSVAFPVILPAVTAIGAFGAVALPVVGAIALAASKVIFDVGKWGVGKIGDLAQIAEEKARKIAYIRSIEKSLSAIEKTLLKNVDKINLNEFKEEYIKSKFPQKSILEEKIKLINDKKFETTQLSQGDIKILEEFKMSLLNSIQ